MTQNPVTTSPADPAVLLAQAIEALQVEIQALSTAPKTAEGAEDASKRFSRAVQNLRILIREARDIAKSSAATAAGASDEEIALYLIDSPVGFAVFQRALATRRLTISSLDGKAVAQPRAAGAARKSKRVKRLRMDVKAQKLDEPSDAHLSLGDLDGW